MPRLKEAVPKYRRRKGRTYPSGRKEPDQAVVTVGGIDHYLGPFNSKASRAEYDRIIAEWLVGGRRNSQPTEPEVAVTVVEILASYLRFAKKYYVKNGKPTSEIEAIKWTVSPLKRMYGRSDASQFGPLALKAVREDFIKSGKSRGVINQCVGRIVRIFKWAAEQELIPASVPQALSMVAGLRKGRSEAKELPPVSLVEDSIIDATLPRLPKVVGDMVRLQRLTGMRPGEVCLVRPRDIEVDGDIWHYRPDSHKTEHHGRDRTVPIGPKGQALLKPYLERDSQEYCFSPAESEQNRRDELHENRKIPLNYGNRPGTNKKRRPKRAAGLRYTTDSYRRAIHRACDKVGVDRWSPNRIRHTSATEIRREFNLEASQVILGHSSADITQVYAERDAALGREVARRLG